MFVTGASGFVGRATLKRLLAAGHEVVAAYHRAAPAEQEGVRWVGMGDHDRPEVLREMLDDSEAVVHLAALAHLPNAEAEHSAEAFMRVNLDGTARIAQAAASARVRRFVFLSSVKACGEKSGARPLRENDPKQPADLYGVSKALAEDRLGEIAARTGMEQVVIRPPLVYGPGVRANFLSLMRWIDRGLPLPFGAIDNRRSFLYVENLADAVARCLEHPAAAGQTYFVSDGEDVSTDELARRIGRALERPARRVSAPVPLLRVVGRLLRREAAVERLTESLAVDISRIRSELEWQPLFSLDAGLRATAGWYHAAHPSAMRGDV